MRGQQFDDDFEINTVIENECDNNYQNMCESFENEDENQLRKLIKKQMQ